MAKKSQLLLIIPAYNEEEAIKDTLENVLNHQAIDPFFDVVVINDGSTDRTKEILDQFASRITAIHLPHNLGIGGAVQTGYQYAKEKNYQYAAQFDADGQHLISELKRIYDPMRNGEADMVIGSRFVEKTGYQGSWQRRIGIAFFTYFIYFCSHLKIMDPTSGFRIKNRKVIEEFAKEYPTDYPEPEVIVTAHRKGWRVKEVSVEMQSRQGGMSSIHSWKTIYYMTKVSLAVMKEWRR